MTREKEYPLFKTHSKSRIFFFAVHDNEKKNSNILVHLDPELKRVKEMEIEFDFAWIDLQGRGAKGTTLTAHKVDRVVNTPRESGSGDEADEKIGEHPVPVSKKTSTESGKSSPVTPKTADSAKEPPQTKEVIKGEAKGKDPKNQATFEF